MKLKLNLRKNLIILFMLIPLVLFAVLISLSSPKPVIADDDDDYVSKIVAVVYDDSASMRDDRKPNGKFTYAKYAMQVLMSTLDSRDKLRVFQINEYNTHSYYNTVVGEDFDVDLEAPDRQAEVSSKISKLTADGSYTPSAKIKTALEWMEGFGLNDLTTVDGVEFKLIIMTDGQYMEVGSYSKYKTTNALITDMISGYKGLQTTFFGIGLNEDDATYSVETTTSVTACYAKTASAILTKMNEITTSTAGRYKMVDGITYGSSRNKVEVDLSKCGFSVKSVAVLAQSNNGAVSLTKASCNAPLIQSRECGLSSISTVSGVQSLYGYTMLLTPDITNDAPKYLTNQKITLEFTSAPSDLLILVEPAVKMESTMLYEDSQGNWKEISELEINSTLTPGKRVKPSYKLIDAGTNTDVTLSFTNVSVNTTYTYVDGGVTITKNETPFELKEGRGEIALKVSLSIGGSKLEFYDSWAFDIDRNPEDYKIISEYTTDKNKVTITYLIMYSGEFVSKNNLQGIYTWNTTLKDPKGINKTLNSTVNNQGIISVTFNMDEGVYGDYVVNFGITREEKIDGKTYKKYRGNVTTVTKEIETLSLTPDKNSITLTTYDIKNNANAFNFTLKDSKYNEDLNFSSNLIDYSFTCGTLDLKPYATISGNKLTFKPSNDMADQLKKVGTYTLTLKVWSKSNPTTIYRTTTAKLVINKTAVTIVTNKTNGYNGDAKKVKVDYTIYANNKVVQESELKGSDAIFNLSNIKVYDPTGKEIACTNTISGGTISVIFDKEIGNYGVYKSQITVEKIGDNNPITSSVNVEYYISNLIITNGTNTEITLNPYQIDKNTKAFEFSVTDNGHPINFNSGLIGYTLKIGNENVTSKATIENNKIIYVPDSKLPNSLRNVANYNVVLSVWSIQNTSVKSSSTQKLNIINAPEFKITTNKTDGVNGDFYKVKLDFIVYYNGNKISQSDLTGDNPNFSWSVLQLVDPTGKKVEFTSDTSGGVISLNFDKTPGNYGEYQATIKVTENYDGRSLESQVKLDYYISNLVITNGNYSKIELNSYQINSNTKRFEFNVTDNGYPINFNSGLIGYTLKIGGVDVTSSAIIEGNILKYIPNSNLPSELQKEGDYNVILQIASNNSNKTATSTLKLSIVKAPLLTIVPKTTDGINGDKYKVKIDYTIYYDGQPISESDIKGANAIFSWNVIEMLDPNGNAIQCTSNVSGSTISIIFDKTKGTYGDYTSKIGVTKIDFKQTVTEMVTVNYGINDLIITNGSNTKIDLNVYKLQSNDKAFEFILTDDGYPINFNSSLIGYTLKVGGIDVKGNATLSGNKLTYVPNSSFPTKLQQEGDYDVVLDVWSKNSNAKTQSILKISIVKAPNFNIVTNVTMGVDGNDDKVKVDYTVYYDDKVVSESDLTGNNPLFSWDVVELKDPNGKKLTPLCSVSGATISVVFEKEKGNYGIYVSKINVTKIDDNRPIVSEVKVEYYISKLIISKPSDNDITLNTYQLKKNNKYFEFSVTDNGYPINFNSGLIGYTLKIGNVDVTKDAVLENNKIKYVPNSNMPTKLHNVADYAVVLEVWSKQNPNIKEQTASKLSIVKAPNFNITTKTTIGVNGDDNKIKVEYTVYYDDKEVSEEELKDGANQVFKLNKVEFLFTEDKNFAPKYTVEYNGGTISIIFDKQIDKFGVYTSKVYVEKIDDSREIDSKVDIECFLTNLKVKKGDENDISLTTYKLRKNDKAFEFSLTNEGRPINFNSGLIGYTFTIDGVDLTDKVVIQNDVLKFVPTTSSLPLILQEIKEKDVVLEVWSIQNPSVNGKAVSKFKLVESVYVVQGFQGDDTTVDIYDLKNCQAKVYFKISVDGNDLSKQELIDGINEGFIQIDAKPFGWIFLLPTSISTEVISYNNSNAICLSVGTKWPSPLDNLFASFIFTGEKPITVTCGNAVGESLITLTHVDFLSRLWRWIVILVTLYFIIHTSLWIIGFFVAKRLPKGVLVQIKLKPDNPKFLINTSSELINTEKKTIILWHLKRYIPFMEFKDQEPISKFGVILQIEERDSVMVHGKLRSIVKLDLDDDETSDLIRKYRRNWQDYAGGSRPSLKLSTKLLNSLIEDMDKEVRPGAVVGLSETYYATKNNKGKIDTILFFKYID